jgi:phosphoribosylamine--glycine ligase
LRVLLIGSGGREHALAAALLRDPALTELHVAPGNPGIEEIALCHGIDVNDNLAVLLLAKELQIELVVVGPEKPLVNGLTDVLRRAGIACFGPSKAAAQLEGSKDFAKKVMSDAGVPTAKSFTCTNRVEVETALDAFGPPYVVKHDGLAAGKGVVVTEDRNFAIEHAIEGLKGSQVVIEEYLAGPEVSLFGISDGHRIIAMQPAQDFKRAFDGDKGPNTGGMGAYSPLPWAPSNLIEQTLQEVLNPTIQEMAARGTPFVGLLYAGLAITTSGMKVIEFNARFGDPETEVLLPRLNTPLASLLMRAATGALLAGEELDWSTDSAVSVVLASPGYPSAPITGQAITGISPIEGAYVFQAATSRSARTLYSDGGRVLVVTGIGSDLTQARDRAYRVISAISLKGSFYRGDIALSAAIAEQGN